MIKKGESNQSGLIHQLGVSFNQLILTSKDRPFSHSRLRESSDGEARSNNAARWFADFGNEILV